MDISLIKALSKMVPVEYVLASDSQTWIGCNVPAQNTLILLNKNLKIYESILRR